MALFIFRKDLRLHDNPALEAAVASGLTLYPIFVHYEEENERVAELAKSAIPEGVMVFNTASLAKTAGVVKTAAAVRTTRVANAAAVRTHGVVKTILKTGLIKAVYVNESPGDSLVLTLGEGSQGVTIHSFNNGTTLLPPGTLRTQAGGFFKKFTPFRNKFLEVYKGPGTEKTVVFKPGKLPSSLGYTIAGKAAARKTALALLKNVKESDPEELLTSKNSQLSPYLALGVVSAREAYRVFKRKRLSSLIDGLIWRDFYYNIATGFPEVLTKSKAFRKEIGWWYRKDTDRPFVLWTQGKTGFPVVDACMRELVATGELCNRGRMIVGSFLTKILLVDWRLGERWFAKNLLDYDQVLNNGNWQWVAGCGADVQQYVRFFNPTNQGLKHDPTGEYVKRWLPELGDASVKEIYSERRKTIVDFGKRREAALKLFLQLNSKV